MSKIEPIKIPMDPKKENIVGQNLHIAQGDIIINGHEASYEMFKEHVKKEKSIHNTNVNIFFLNNSNHGMIKKDVIFFL